MKKVLFAYVLFVASSVSAANKEEVDFHANVKPPSVDVFMQAPGVFDPILDAFVLRADEEYLWTAIVVINSAVVEGKENAQPSAEDLSELIVLWMWKGEAVVAKDKTKKGVLQDTEKAKAKPTDGIALQKLTVEISGKVRVDGVWYKVAKDQFFDAAPIKYVVLPNDFLPTAIFEVPPTHILYSDGSGKLVTGNESPPGSTNE